jgi:hypothetical protein
VSARKITSPDEGVQQDAEHASDEVQDDSGPDADALPLEEPVLNVVFDEL